ncbi:MAG: hypothetical protein A4E68_01916 [Syntrophaceae bacterium PtaB.Bin095]|jgi:hypothetical protein|nr:MAG: hypothetical protein A4E68_01916 [Syntrophaceae bacterium PtaB.Bin095]
MSRSPENRPPVKDRQEVRLRLRKELHESRKFRLIAELMVHIGRQNAIGMAELYEIIYGAGWTNRINDTREIRKLIEELHNEGLPICSVSNRSGGGYYLAAAGSELEGFLQARERRAKKILRDNARIKKIAFPAYWGQGGRGLDHDG